MTHYNYKVVPATARGQKAKGVKTPEERFALALEHQLNGLAEDGWEYVRADMLPSQERSGLTGTTTEWRHMLIFRRAVTEDGDAPDLLAAPEVTGDSADETMSVERANNGLKTAR